MYNGKIYSCGDNSARQVLDYVITLNEGQYRPLFTFCSEEKDLKLLEKISNHGWMFLISEPKEKVEEWCVFLVSKGIDARAEEIKKKPSKPTYTPKCPTCQSPDVVKITGTQRMIGTGLFGLGAGSLGKSMRCKNCGYKW